MLILRAKTPDEDEVAADPPGRWIAGLSNEMPLMDALELIYLQRFQGVVWYLPLAADKDENVEYLHKLRVACRRLGVVLDVLAEGFSEPPRQSLAKLLRKIRRCCGQARDLDVRRTVLESQLSSASVEDAAVIELLCEQTVRKRARVQQTIRRKLTKLRPDLNQAGAVLLSSLRSVRRDADDGYSSFGKTGRRILAKELAALWDLAAWELAARDLTAQDRESTAALHRLRIALKHLRYASEIFIPILPPSFCENFYPHLEEVQDLLGEAHDATEAARICSTTQKKWKSWRGKKKWARRGLAGFRWGAVRHGLEVTRLACVQQGAHARTEFLEFWPGFSGDSFRRPVAALLAILQDPAISVAGVDPTGEDVSTAGDDSTQGDDSTRGESKDYEHLLPH